MSKTKKRQADKRSRQQRRLGFRRRNRYFTGSTGSRAGMWPSRAAHGRTMTCDSLDHRKNSNEDDYLYRESRRGGRFMTSKITYLASFFSTQEVQIASTKAFDEPHREDQPIIVLSRRYTVISTKSHDHEYPTIPSSTMNTRRTTKISRKNKIKGDMVTRTSNVKSRWFYS